MAKTPEKATSFTPWPVPAFALPCSDGSTVRGADLKGHWTVLFLYPADNTPTCTDEACAFSLQAGEFARRGVKLYGLSKDDLKSHGKFISRYGLAMPLLSDESTETIAAFGAWTEKNMYGRAYMGTERSTFLIDPDGMIRHEWRKVRIKGHVDNVLTVLDTFLD